MKAKIIFRMVAKQNGITEREVRMEIQKAITAAWREDNEITNLYQQKILHKGGIPTPEELIEHIYREIAFDKVKKLP